MNRRREYLSKSGKELPEFLTGREINRLIDSVEVLRDRAILETMYATGCRPKELRDMKVSNINFTTKEIRVMGKNGEGSYTKERILLVTEKALSLIMKYIEKRKPKPGFEDILFLNRRGEALSAGELNNMVKKRVFGVLGKKIERPNPAYIIRHSFATMMMNRNVGLPYISEMMGHESYISTQVYTHTSTQRLVEVHRKFHPRA